MPGRKPSKGAHIMSDLDVETKTLDEEIDSSPRFSGRWSAFHRSVNWPQREGNWVRSMLHALERISLALEKPINRIAKNPHLNPLYHTGAITIWLLIFITITGVYLLMFYQFGFDVSYLAVSNVERSLVGRVIRAAHRYASDLAIIMALLHAWRMFFMDRFRGPRWLAWVTGMAMAVAIWFTGVTGYWMVADIRAQALNQIFVDLIGRLPGGDAIILNHLIPIGPTSGWVLFVTLFFIHIGLPLILILFIWLHIKRLQRGKILPPRYWIWLSLGFTAVAAILIPVGMLPKHNVVQLPGRMDIDVWYLAALPAALHMNPTLFWVLNFLVLSVVTAIPWLLGDWVRPKLDPIVVHEDKCIGCTLCAKDCPYKALTMVERTDGKPHKYVAVVDPKMCVSCGVCIGSCPTDALTLGDQSVEALWLDTVARASQQEKPVKVVFACERHVFQGARPFMMDADHPGALETEDQRVEIVPLTCAAMAHPNLVAQALEAGASEVQIIGCPPEDCANREGNVWEELRLKRERQPKLKRQFAGAPISMDWVPPNDFAQALNAKEHQTEATSYRFTLRSADWAKLLPALALLALFMAITVGMSLAPYTAFGDQDAAIEVQMQHRSGVPVWTPEQKTVDSADLDFTNAADPHLVVKLDGETVVEKRYARDDDGVAYAYEYLPIASGKRHLTVLLIDRSDQTQPQVIFDGELTLQGRQIFPIIIKDAVIAGANPERGKDIFFASSIGSGTGCRLCHSLKPDEVKVGPSLAGIATLAATRVPGMSAEEYIRESILHPDAHIVPGFDNKMPSYISEGLSPQDIDDLVGFLMTLK
ncbi:MAG TPA: hydrogenase iron-sulfur subunit [Caldilineales bacterium]|nr:hydrogenase iron-sulfur subunit [Caldilineales bacterium]